MCFLFCFIFLRLGAEVAGNWKCSWEQFFFIYYFFLSPNKSLLTLLRGPEKGQPRETENFYNFFTSTTSTTINAVLQLQKTCGPNPTHACKDGIGSWLSLLQIWYQRRPSWEPGISSLPTKNNPIPSHGVRGTYTRGVWISVPVPVSWHQVAICVYTAAARWCLPTPCQSSVQNS